jgi:enolase-like protein
MWTRKGGYDRFLKDSGNCCQSATRRPVPNLDAPHLAVATNCRQIKTGSLARSDRAAKYHQCCGNAEQEVISGSYRQ